MGSTRTTYPTATSARRWQRQTLAQQSGGAGRHSLDTAHRSTLDGPPEAISTIPDLPSSLPVVGTLRRARPGVASLSSRLRGARSYRLIGMLHRRHLRGG